MALLVSVTTAKRPALLPGYSVQLVLCSIAPVDLTTPFFRLLRATLRASRPLWWGCGFFRITLVVDDDTANRIIDLQAEIAALRGAVRMLIQNIYGGDGRSLAIIQEEALRGDDLTVYDKEPGDRGSRYRDGVREAVASLLDPFEPDDDEASRLANPSPLKRPPPANN